MIDDSGIELIERWKDINKAWHFEGSTRNLEKLVNVLGYYDQGFGGAVMEFLNDNPGAQGAIVEWIGEFIDRNPEWRDAMLGEVGCQTCNGSQPPGEYGHRLRPYFSWLETQSDEEIAAASEISPASATAATISASR